MVYAKRAGGGRPGPGTKTFNRPPPRATPPPCPRNSSGSARRPNARPEKIPTRRLCLGVWRDGVGLALIPALLGLWPPITGHFAIRTRGGRAVLAGAPSRGSRASRRRPAYISISTGMRTTISRPTASRPRSSRGWCFSGRWATLPMPVLGDDPSTADGVCGNTNHDSMTGIRVEPTVSIGRSSICPMRRRSWGP
jgi:hypothetical protein